MTYRIRNMAIATGLALVAMLLTLFYVVNYRRSVQHEQATVQVYVAAHNISAGKRGADLAHSRALRVVSVARRNVVPGAISDPNEVASLVLTEPIYAGEQVTLRRFSDVHAQGIRGELKGTMRAVDIAGDVNQLLVGTLRDGDHVDLVANLRTDPNAELYATRVVLRDLTVLQAPTTSSTPGPANQQASAIVAVTDTQVQRLFFVLKNAAWTFELRPAVDAADSPERIDTLASVLTSGVR